MADVYEQNLPNKANLTTNDYIRVVGSDNNSYKQLVSDVAKKIIENYTGSSLAGSSQSVKSALDTLNSKTIVQSVSYTFGDKTWWFYKVDRIVVVIAPHDVKSASSGMNTVTANLPAEYRPFTQVYFGIQNAQNDNQYKCFLSVSANGTVSFYTPVAISSAQNCGIVGCYITQS